MNHEGKVRLCDFTLYTVFPDLIWMTLSAENTSPGLKRELGSKQKICMTRKALFKENLHDQKGFVQ